MRRFFICLACWLGLIPSLILWAIGCLIWSFQKRSVTYGRFGNLLADVSWCCLYPLIVIVFNLVPGSIRLI
jgi:hypothetical protein